MALRYKTRRWLALLILLVGMPIYILLARNILAWMGRPPIWLELLVYIGLGVVWILPFKFVFLGIGQADPEAKRPPDEH